MRKLRVLVVDDNPLFLGAARNLLSGLPEVGCAEYVNSGAEALAKATGFRPDLVLMDIAMKALNGLDATAQIKREFPQMHVIILSMHTAEDFVQQALKAGAAGYLLKDAAVPELETAITAVMRGEVYLCPQISRLVVQSYLQHAGGVEGPLSVLTRRQREILELIAKGRTAKDIAYRLHLSVKTVETHRAQIMERLDIHDIAGLVRFAIRVRLGSKQHGK